MKLLLSTLASCVVLNANQLEEYTITDNALAMIYMQHRNLDTFGEMNNCFSIDSIRIIYNNKRFVVYGDYSEQEFFVYKTTGMHYYFRNLKKIKCFTSNPYDNHYIYGGDRYTFSDAEEQIVIVFKISCRLRKMIPNNNCWIDSSAFFKPNEISSMDIDECYSFGVNCTDVRTLYKGEYYLIDSVFNYRSLDSIEVAGLRMTRVDNSKIIKKYGIW